MSPYRMPECDGSENDTFGFERKFEKRGQCGPNVMSVSVLNTCDAQCERSKHGDGQTPKMTRST